MATDYINEAHMFSNGPGARPYTGGNIEVWGVNPAAQVTGGLFTVTNSGGGGNTIANANIGGRPCWSITNTNSTATDVVQFQTVAGGIILQAGKSVRIKWSMRMTTTTQEWLFGLNALDTSVIASDSTDFLHVEKLTGVTAPSFRARKASGTAESTTLSLTFAADTWYDFELLLKRDASTAGKGIYQVWGGSGISAGGMLPYLGGNTVATQFADTVALCPTMAWRAGSAANVSGYISYFGVRVEG